MIRLLTLTVMMVAMLAPGAFAQTTGSQTAAAGQSDEDAKRDLYVRFTGKIKKDRPGAYQDGKEYVEKYPNDNSPQAAYIKKYIAAYESDQKAAETGKEKSDIAQLVKDKKYDQAYAKGRQFLAGHPDDLATTLNTAWSGWQLSFKDNASTNAEAGNYARKAIQLIEAGKTPVEGQAFTAKDETLGWLNYALGTYALASTSPDAAGFFIKAAQFEGFAKKDPTLYERLAVVYQATEYTKLAEDYKTRFSTEESRATPEGKAATERINDSIDRIIDAYARAVAYSGTEPRYAAKKADWTKQLTDFYKFRHDNSTTGLDQLIASVTGKPLPQPGQPVTSTAPAASSSTVQPASSSGTANATVGTSVEAKPATTSTTTKATVTTTTAKPSVAPSATTKTTVAPATGAKTKTTTTTTKRP
ncbi:MAG: hypothetical protein ABR577_12975 [Pyrinomonadaceae bacterium]